MFDKIKQSFKDHPWQNSLLIVLVIVIGVMAFFVFGGKLTGKSENKVVFFPGEAKNYYVPETTTEPSTLPKDSTEVKTTTLVENLYNYGNHDDNVSTGLRKLNKTSYKNGLIGLANAATRFYPVIYYYDITKDPQIIEINGLTGEKKTIITEKYPITSLDFSEVNQALVYAVASSNNQVNKSGSAKIYYLNTGKSTTIWDNVPFGAYSQPAWSPNGKYIKGTITESTKQVVDGYQADPLSVYDVEKNTTESHSCPENSHCDGQWGDDNKTLLGVMSSIKKGAVNWYDDSFVTTDAFTGESNVIDDGHKSTGPAEGRQLLYTQMINNKLFGLAHTPYNVDTSNYANAGWLFTYDLGKKEAKSFQSQMGMNNYYLFLINKDGSKIVYIDLNDNRKVKILNTNTGEIKVLDKTAGVFISPQGWNGNEDNFISIAWNNFYNVNLTTGVVTKITK